MRIAALFVLTALTTGLVGCDPYVNIPGQPGSIADTSVNDLGVREAIAVSLKYVMRNDPPAGEFALLLPDGTTDYSYTKVFSQVGSGRRFSEADAAAPVYEVISVQVRGLDGQVDLVPPIETTDGEARVQTVYLRHRLDSWHAQRSKLWNMSVSDAMELANPAAAPRFRDYQPPRAR